MEIDIIDYVPEQFAALSSTEIERVRTAQKRKDTLLLALNEKLRKAKEKMIDNGVFLSNVWTRMEEELTAAYEAEVKIIRDGLLFYLHYASGAYDSGRVPPSDTYPVDYTLTIAQRMASVRDYYLETYEDPSERFETFKVDEFAKAYLGEGYASLWHYFEELAK